MKSGPSPSNSNQPPRLYPSPKLKIGFGIKYWRIVTQHCNMREPTHFKTLVFYKGEISLCLNKLCYSTGFGRYDSEHLYLIPMQMAMEKTQNGWVH
ncbi:hypothetical protein Nepgr_004437 [Nepenthes gracilis]|uniref:Uncharacterized protein n=1 Tax=Nepenthes gracilis TaxID=150966 RepID=A0AAD3S1E8_NEPGR|nr:hypothetical protein Nepgr_004437 [Nepenthes gracilis]